MLKKVRPLLKFSSYVKPYGLNLVVLFVLSSLATLVGLVPTYIMKPLTDKVFVPTAATPLSERWSMLNFLVIVMLVLYALRVLLSSVVNYQRRWLAEKIGVDIKDAVFSKLQFMPLRFFTLEKPGSLHSRVFNDTTTLNSFLPYQVMDLLMAVITLIGMGGILFYLRWKLALVMIVPVPLVVLLSRMFGERIQFAYRLVHQKVANLSGTIFVAITSAVVVKANVAEHKELARFRRFNNEAFASKIQLTKVDLLFTPLKGFLIFFCGTLVYWIGGRDVIRQQMTLGDLMVFIGFMWQFYVPVETIGSFYSSYQDFFVSSERVFKILDGESETGSGTALRSLPGIRGGIEFDKVGFSYDGKKNVLEDISFSLRPGEVLGVTGPSGAGKSTMNLLLCRIHDVTGGSVRVDGHDVKEIDPISLRRQIGLILQETWLFYGTIAENISYGKSHVSREEIVAAARAAGAHDFIMRQPDAYDTFIGELGAGLSGGERQRIAIARVLLKNPKIIIFDEATSSVDSETEAFIQASIARMAGGHTIVIVSHRLSMLKCTDKIVVLDRGRIVEAGSFEDLRAEGTLFNRLRMVQEV